MPDRAQYEAWITATNRTQRRLKLGLVPGVIAAIALTMWSHALGGLALVSCGIVAVFGFWITSSHVAGWHAEISRLDRPTGELTRDGRLKRERE